MTTLEEAASEYRAAKADNDAAHSAAAEARTALAKATSEEDTTKRRLERTQNRLLATIADPDYAW